MTQASRPQADHIDNYPAPSDPGPYSSDQWAQLFQIFFTGDQQATQGPFARYLNELEPTDNASTEVYVDTGAGVVNGHILVSSEKETWTVPAGPAGGRQGRVVMVENNNNTEVTQSTAGRSLLFPNDLSEYTGTPGVPAYSARLAILRGDDLNNLPALDQTNALYMVELYRYSIENSPTISSATDYRDFCEFSTWIDASTIEDRTRYAFVPAVGGDGSVSGPGLPSFDAVQYGILTINTETSTIAGYWTVPADFSSVMTVQAVVIPTADCNVWCTTGADYGACGEAYNAHQDSTVAAAVAVTNGDYNCVQETSLASAAVGDIICFSWRRTGTHGSDTCTDVYCVGWLVSYTADM